MTSGINYWFPDISKHPVDVYDIEGCNIEYLDMFEDDRGYLVPLISEVNPKVLYCYYSVTYAGFARDMDKWHYHKCHTDRFVVLNGCAVFALATNSDMQLLLLNMALNGVLTVGPGVYHCFRVYGDRPVRLLNVPDAIYDPEDEYRIAFDELGLHPW